MVNKLTGGLTRKKCNYIKDFPMAHDYRNTDSMRIFTKNHTAQIFRYHNLISQILRAGQFCIGVYQYLQKNKAHDILFLLMVSAVSQN